LIGWLESSKRCRSRNTWYLVKSRFPPVGNKSSDFFSESLIHERISDSIDSFNHTDSVGNLHYCVLMGDADWNFLGKIFSLPMQKYIKQLSMLCLKCKLLNINF